MKNDNIDNKNLDRQKEDKKQDIPEGLDFLAVRLCQAAGLLVVGALFCYGVFKAVEPLARQGLASYRQRSQAEEYLRNAPKINYGGGHYMPTNSSSVLKISG